MSRPMGVFGRGGPASGQATTGRGEPGPVVFAAYFSVVFVPIPVTCQFPMKNWATITPEGDRSMTPIPTSV